MGSATSFLVGLGVGVAVGVLLAPQPGEDTREWITDNAGAKITRLRRKGRRWVLDAQEILDKSEDTVSKILRTGRDALGTVASRLD